MENVAFSAVFNWVITHSYSLIFVGMVLEGPIITAAAAFAAALGYFDLRIILLLSFLGDLVGDLVYYTIGRHGGYWVLERYGRWVGLTSERLAKIEERLATHPAKTLLAVKFVPPLTATGLIAIGALRMPLRKFAAITAMIIIPWTLTFGLLGYYFGYAYADIAKRLNNVLGGAILLGIIVIVAGAAYYYFFTKAKKEAERELK